LSELATQMEQYGVVLDPKESAGLLERIIIRELTALSAAPNETICKRIASLLDIVDRYKIPVLKHKIEDAFCADCSRHLRNIGNEIDRLESAAARSPDEERILTTSRALLIALTEFARRMNFNTDTLKAK